MKSKDDYLQFKGVESVVSKDRFDRFLGFLKDGCSQLVVWNYGKIHLDYTKKTKSFQLALIFKDELPSFTRLEFLKRWSDGLTKLIVDVPYNYNGRTDQENKIVWFFEEKEN